MENETRLLTHDTHYTVVVLLVWSGFCDDPFRFPKCGNCVVQGSIYSDWLEITGNQEAQFAGGQRLPMIDCGRGMWKYILICSLDICFRVQQRSYTLTGLFALWKRISVRVEYKDLDKLSHRSTLYIYTLLN